MGRTPDASSMDEVRQAHLPGNYELYDEASNKIGSVICKLCWEEAGKINSSSLDTVWLSVDGWEVVWWLCQTHHEGIGFPNDESILVLRTETGVVRTPAIGK